MMFFLFACKGTPLIDQPKPPPTPPPSFVKVDPTLVTVTGTVSEVHGPTRSWVLTSGGTRRVCHLDPNGSLRLDGKASLVEDMTAGITLSVEGHGDADLVIVSRAMTPGAAEAEVVPLPVPVVAEPAVPEGGVPPTEPAPP